MLAVIQNCLLSYMVILYNLCKLVDFMLYDMKKYYINMGILLGSIFLFPTVITAQITVVPSVAAAVMANKLVGTGVIIMAPTLTCAANAYGTFAGPSSLSFDSGIILTNGTAIQ